MSLALGQQACGAGALGDDRLPWRQMCAFGPRRSPSHQPNVRQVAAAVLPALPPDWSSLQASSCPLQVPCGRVAKNYTIVQPLCRPASLSGTHRDGLRALAWRPTARATAAAGLAGDAGLPLPAAYLCCLFRSPCSQCTQPCSPWPNAGVDGTRISIWRCAVWRDAGLPTYTLWPLSLHGAPE